MRKLLAFLILLGAASLASAQSKYDKNGNLLVRDGAAPITPTFTTTPTYTVTPTYTATPTFTGTASPDWPIVGNTHTFTPTYTPTLTPTPSPTPGTLPDGFTFVYSSAASGNSGVITLPRTMSVFSVAASSQATPTAYTVNLQGSLDGVNWTTLVSCALADGQTIKVSTTRPVRYIRFNQPTVVPENTATIKTNVEGTR